VHRASACRSALTQCSSLNERAARCRWQLRNDFVIAIDRRVACDLQFVWFVGGILLAFRIIGGGFGLAMAAIRSATI
jgi:hypothetical protein